MVGFTFISLAPIYKSMIVPRDRFPLFRLKSDGLFLLFLIFFILWNTSCHVLRILNQLKLGPVNWGVVHPPKTNNKKGSILEGKMILLLWVKK